MTEREIADRIRATLTVHSDFDLIRLADELDPPRPEPGTVVWWRIDLTVNYHIGLISIDSKSIVDIDARTFPIDEAQWKPARIAGPMQEIVDIPPLREWPDNADYAELRLHYGRGEMTTNVRFGITRDEAARRQAEG